MQVEFSNYPRNVLVSLFFIHKMICLEANKKHARAKVKQLGIYPFIIFAACSRWR